MLTRQLLSAILIAFLTIAAGSSARAQTSEPDPVWDRAAELSKQRHYEAAAAAFLVYADAHAGSPKQVDALIEAAFCYFRMGRQSQVLHRNQGDGEANFETARALFDQAAGILPSHPQADRARYMAGSASLFLGDLDLAAFHYRRVITDFGPNAKYYPKASVRLASVQFSLLEHEEGIRTLHQYRDRKPQTDNASAGKADRYLGYAKLFGRPAPPLQAETWIQGAPVDLPSLQGRVVALYFTTTWCPNCKKELDFVQTLQQRFGSELTVVGVTDRSQDQTPESVRAYLEENGVTYPYLMDLDSRTSKAFDGGSIPNLVLIDRRGRVRWHDHPGALADRTIEMLIAEQ